MSVLLLENARIRKQHARSKNESQNNGSNTLHGGAFYRQRLSGEKLIAGHKDTPAEDAFVEFDKAPEPIGGYQLIFENVRYPESAKKDGAEGIVFVSVVIEADGSVSGLEIAEYRIDF